MKKTKLQKQREWELNKEISNGLIQLGNISLAGLMFGQAFGGFKFQLIFALTGIFIFALLYSSGIILMKRAIRK